MKQNKYIKRGYTQDQANYLYLFDVTNKQDYINAFLNYIVEKENINYDAAILKLHHIMRIHKKERINRDKRYKLESEKSAIKKDFETLV